MSSTKVVTPAEWRTARIALLEKEKEHTRAKDALSAARRSLPIVEIQKPYTFTSIDDASGKETTLSFSDLFGSHRQLIVYHFMFGPSDETGCVGCTMTCDNIGPLEHLNARDTTLVCISRAPIAKLNAYKKRMGWKFPWYSSYGSDFNYDFHATQDSDIAPVENNFRTAQEMKDKGIPYYDSKGEQQGFSCFVKGGKNNESDVDIGEHGKIYHTYSGFARAIEPANGLFGWLDFTLLGRQDAVKVTSVARRDEYEPEELKGSA